VFQELRVLSYNIAGLKSKRLFPNFFKYVASFDVFFLQETFVVTEEIDCCSKYFGGFCLQWIPAIKESKFGRAKGGQVYGFKTQLKIDYDAKFENLGETYMLKMKLTDAEITVIPTYLSHSNWSEDLDKLQLAVDRCCENNLVLLGDLNGRVGLSQQHTKNIIFDNIARNRHSKDPILDSKGKKLLNLFQEFNGLILNGRTNSDINGELTFVGGMGSSVIDYCVVAESIGQLISDFKIDYQTFSDHMPLDLKLITRKPDTTRINIMPRLYLRENHVNSYRDRLEVNVAEVGSLDFDSCESLSEKIKVCILRSIKMPNINMNKKKKKDWYNWKCERARKKSFACLRLFRRQGTDLARLMYMKANIEFKEVCKEAKGLYVDELVKKLESLDSGKKEWWMVIKEINNESFIKSPHIHIQDFQIYFQSLLNTESGNNSIQFAENFIADNTLDECITIDELETVLHSLPSNKSPGPDRIPYECFKYSSDNFKILLVELYNKIMNTGEIPGDFKTSIIFPIHKGGSVSEVSNYRGISFSNTVGKIFACILLKRLEVWAEDKMVLNEFQAGFRKGYSTFDNIYTLQSIVQLYKKKFYCFFIDFKAAFDRIDRNALMFKLHSCGISSKLFKIIRDWYEETNVAIWDGNLISEWFVSKTGLRQGCILSPFLFAIFINDLHDIVGRGIQFLNMNVRLLMYADDVVLIADKRESLQFMINRLSSYCSNWNLELNLVKSKVLIFNKTGRLAKSEKWHFDGKPLEIVNEYKYLGFLLTSRMSLSKHFDAKIKNAKFAMNSVWKNVLVKPEIKTTVKIAIYYSIARSIVCYAGQVWGSNEFEMIERYQRKYLKWIFNLPSSTPNYMLLTEFGLPSLYAYTLKLHKNYILKTLNMKDNRLPKKITLHALDTESLWVENWKKLANEVGFQFNVQDLEALRKAFDSIIYKKAGADMDEAVRRVNDSSSNNLYRNLSLGVNLRYLNDDRPPYAIGLIFKLRTNLLNLNGTRIVHDGSNLCSLCNLNEVEDVVHFVATCPVLNEFRIRVFSKARLERNEVISILNGWWDSLIKYCTMALSYRRFLVEQFNN
jgi:hypothetical protein